MPKMPKWFDSIRSHMGIWLILTFCFIAVWSAIKEKLVLDSKDFVAIVTIVITFYFALKDRSGNGVSK